ncbi:MAG: M4 family metallopeptidase [Candidatus Moraniibacteriota bacterium]
MQNKKKKIKAKIIYCGIATFLIVALGSISNTQAAEKPADLTGLKKDFGKNIEISFNKATAKLNFLAKKYKQEPLWAAKGKNKTNEAISIEFLQKYGSYFGIQEPKRDLKFLQEVKDEIGMSHLRYNQKWQGVPVFGGQLIIHLNDKQAVTAVNGKTNPVKQLEVKPEIGQKEAGELAKKYWAEKLKGEPQLASDPRLYIYNKKFLKNQDDANNYLVWEVDLYSKKPYSHEFLYIDALNGSLIDRREAIKKAVDRRVYNCKAWNDYSNCVLEDTIHGIDHGRSEGVAARGITDIDNLYDYTSSIHNYFVDTFTRSGANGLGGLGDGIINPYEKTDSYGRIDYDLYKGVYCPANAFFDDSAWSGGATINFCDGMVTKDVVGHEYAHGVSYFSILDGYGNPSGLIYAYEPGALEEGDADIFGEAVENYINGSSDWQMGEGVAGGPFRSMASPGSINDSGYGVYPDKFNSANFDCDYWEVHHNSTVVSHAAYLMAMGGTFNGCTISGIGRTKEEAIFYRAITQYLTVISGFNDAYDALNAACTDLYGVGSTDCQNVKKALRSTEMDQEGACSGSPTVAPECDFTRAPTVSSVSSSLESGNYNIGDVIDIDVYFSELVTSTGSVTVIFNTGGSCTFTVSGQSMGTCDYTIRPEDIAFNNLDVASISGSINDQDGNAMVNFSPSSNLSQNRLISFDSVAPVISGVENGGVYRTDITPTFNEGTATLNGEAFVSGQTISADGDYTLAVTDDAGNSTTITFRIEKVVSSVPALTYKRKKATSRMRLTFYGLNLSGKLKRSGFKVRFNGRRANVASVKNTTSGLVINMRFKYAKWPQGQYNLVMNYGYKAGKMTVRGSVSKNSLFSIN